MTAAETRPATAVDALAEDYYATQLALDPVLATFDGDPGHDAELPAFDPDWLEANADLRRRTLRDLAAASPADQVDEVTVAALREALETAQDLHDAGILAAKLTVLDSPLQHARDVFDLMATDTADDWSIVATRLSAVPAALRGYTASLRAAAAAGRVAARRQVEAGAGQCDDNVGPDGYFAKLAARTAELPDAVRADVERAAAAAADGYAELATFLRDELHAQAPERDAIGRAEYPLHSRAFLGTRIDLDETYAWGQQELARIEAEKQATAQRIRPDASVDETMAFLDESPEHKLVGTDALQRWMQETSDAAVAALADTHFDIPEPIRRLECVIAPTQTGGIYYTNPSEDLVTRPGRMWWSVPKGETEFGTWRERSIVYHEGVPGHHLQIGQTMFRAQLLNRWRRMGSWISGHGEGWALYAERLMADLGFLDNPADHLGMLDGQSVRAARVVLDIGVHCELPAPDEVGGGAWDYDKAWQFLCAHMNASDGFRRFELDRYLGWPGQAPSYKIGERLWLQLREDARAAEGDAFDLAAFHRRALDVGSVGLDALRVGVLS